MATSKHYGRAIDNAISEILREKTPAQLKKEFNEAYAGQIESLYQQYLLMCACEKLKGSEAVLNQTIQELPLPSRVKNILDAIGIGSVRELVNYSYMDLSHLRELGRISLKQIEDYLSMVGLSLRKK